MSKCVITGEETNDYTKGTPLSREGRRLLEEITDLHNEKIFAVYKERNKEANGGTDLDDATLRNFAPKISRNRALKYLVGKEPDIMKTKLEVLGER